MPSQKYASNNLGGKFSRREFLGRAMLTGIAATMPLLGQGGAPALAAHQDSPDAATASPAQAKPLIVYFSQSGNTQKLAAAIHKKVGGDILRIETVAPYPQDYDTLTEQAKAEQRASARPQLKTEIPDLAAYGMVFLGFPNWWSGIPMPVAAFVERCGLNGKTIAPFCTHGGGGLGHSVEDIKKLCPDSKILRPLAVSGSRAGSAEKDVEKWLAELA